jgi:hypothetical protein
MSRLSLTAPLAALLLACPQAQSRQDVAEADQPGVGRSDARVVADTGDLYPGKAPTAPEPDAATPGTGRPDETNGSCRLFAPELKGPECCEETLGFDVEAARAACDLPVYLGESIHNSCGFYFVREPGTPVSWFRLSTILGDTPLQAADDHVRLLRRAHPNAEHQPLPGVPGGYWVKQDEYRWAFLPGWKKVRLLAWKDTSCSDEGIAALAQTIVAAPEAVPPPRRKGLIPAAAPALAQP